MGACLNNNKARPCFLLICAEKMEEAVPSVFLLIPQDQNVPLFVDDITKAAHSTL